MLPAGGRDCAGTSADMTDDLNFDPFSENITDASEPARVKTDRRITHRTTSERLTYIHLEPDSGAIVLNVSNGGLGFHAVAPIHHSGVINFWFSLHADHRIEGKGEVAWTDATKKTGGLRFDGLPNDVREQIRNWVLQCGIPPKPKSERINAARGSSHITPDSTSQEAEARIAAPAAALNASSISAPLKLSAATVKPVPATRATSSTISNGSERRKPLRPAGVIYRAKLLKSSATVIRRAAAGAVFTAMLIAAAALIYHQERHPAPVGLAEQFTPIGDVRADAATNDAALAETAPPVALTAAPISAANNELATEISKLEAEYEPAAGALAVAKRRKSVPVSRSSARSSATPLEPNVMLQRREVLQPRETNTALAPSLPSEASPGSLLAAGGSAGTEVPQPQTPQTQPKQSQTPSRPAVAPQPADEQREVVFSATGKYFDVGNFSDALWAERAQDELARAGLHALVIHKTRLWLSSYHVIVGPYTEGETAAALEELEGRGFKPRLFK